MRALLQLVRRHFWASVSMAACLLGAALVEGFGITALLPFVSFAVRGGAASDDPSRLEQAVLEVLAAVGLTPSLSTLLWVVVLAFVAKGLLVLLARLQVGYTVARVMTELRQRLLAALMRSRWSFYVSQRIGTFSNAYGMEVSRSAKLYLEGGLLLSHAIESLVYLAIAFAASAQATLAALGVGSLIMLVFSRLIRIGRKAGVKQTRVFSRVSEQLIDILQGVKPLKAMGREQEVTPMLQADTRRIERARRKEIFSREAMSALYEPLFVPFLAGGVYVGMTSFSMQFEEVALLGLVAARAIRRLNNVQRRYQNIAVEESAYWSLMAKIEAAEGAQETHLDRGETPTLERSIRLKGVRVEYDGRPVVDSLDLEVPSGEITALIGISGAGKTTVLDLVVGLIQPAKGEVLVDGRDLSGLNQAAWRRHIGYVPQETFLRHASIYENVALASPHATRAEVERALRDAHAWDFVQALRAGMDTVVGERGSVLSGGQRQRISIARALLNRPWLLILDEATAALDPEAEEAVWQAVLGLRGRTTVLAVSHQSPLQRIADRCYRIADGVAQPVPGPRPEPAPDARPA